MKMLYIKNNKNLVVSLENNEIGLEVIKHRSAMSTSIPKYIFKTDKNIYILTDCMWMFISTLFLIQQRLRTVNEKGHLFE